MSDLGKKLTCQSCGAKFFDLKKPEPVCPSCDTVLVIEKAKPKRTQPAPEAEKPKAAEPVKKKNEEDGDDDGIEMDVDVDLMETDDEDGDEDEGLIEDTSDIGEDEDDMAGVIENIEGEDKE